MTLSRSTCSPAPLLQARLLTGDEVEVSLFGVRCLSQVRIRLAEALDLDKEKFTVRIVHAGGVVDDDSDIQELFSLVQGGTIFDVIIENWHVWKPPLVDFQLRGKYVDRITRTDTKYLIKYTDGSVD